MTLEIDIVDMLGFLGVNHVEKEGKEVWFECPFPGHKPGSGNRNASFRQSSKHEWWVFNCFVCGNHGTAADFWAMVMDVRPAQARTAIKGRYGSSFIDPGEGNAVLDEIERILQGDEEEFRLPVAIPEQEILDRAVDWNGIFEALCAGDEVPPALSYMFERGFFAQTLIDNDIGYDPTLDMLSIPYRNAEGELVAFKGRAWQPDAKPKYRMLGNKGGETRFNFATVDIRYLLYGEWNLPPGERIILCEGELNKLALNQYGHRRVLGLSGQFLRPEQATVLTRNADEVVLLFDEEEKAEAAAETLLQRGLRVQIVPEHDGDPADSSDEDVASWLDDAYSATVLE